MAESCREEKTVWRLVAEKQMEVLLSLNNESLVTELKSLMKFARETTE